MKTLERIEKRKRERRVRRRGLDVLTAPAARMELSLLSLNRSLEMARQGFLAFGLQAWAARMTHP